MIKIYKYFFFLIIFTGIFKLINAQQLFIYYAETPLENNQTFKSYTFSDSLQLVRKLEGEIESDLSEGYALAGYDSIIYANGIVNAYYKRGCKFEWKNLSYNDSLIPSELSKYINRKFKLLNVDNLKVFSDKLLKYYADRGFPFASVRLDSILISGNSISANLNIVKGAEYKFDSIIIKGDAKIKPYYIRKTIDINKDDVFSFSVVSNIDRQLKTLPFVEQSRPYQLAFSENDVDILLYLKDRKASRFSGLIGIQPNNKTTGKLLITGDVDLYLLNSAGIGDLFVFKWQKYESLSQNLKTEISVPYLFKSDFGAGLKFDLDKKDTSYLNTDFSSKIIFGSNTAGGFEFYYRRKSSYLIGENSGLTNSNYSDYSINLYGINYRFVSTDNIYNPRKGINLKLSSGFGSKITGTDTDATNSPVFQSQNSADISWFIPLGSYMVIKLRNYTSSVYSKSISDNELDLIGGLNTIRGFDELSLPASSFSIVNFELRYIFEEKSAVFAFADAGYFEKRNTANDYYNFAEGIGVGLDLSTTAGVFSLVYAIGKQNDNALMFSNSKIHFGYRNSF